MQEYDHAKLIQGDPEEMKRFRNWLITPVESRIMHDADGSCCRRESWSKTLQRIHVAVGTPGMIFTKNIDWTDGGFVSKEDSKTCSGSTND